MSVSRQQLKGIVPPLPTPFGADGDVDSGALERLVSKLAPFVDGYLVLGSNGEAAYLDENERDDVIRTARGAVSSDKPLLVGTGGEATRQVIDRSMRAADLGADAVLVLAPHYFRGQMRDDALRRHFEAVASASPVPALLYDIPQVTGLPLPPTLIGDLSRHPNIIGLKDSSGNVGALTEIFRLAADDFVVFTGNAPTLLPALALGARGGILAVANVAPKGYRQLLEDVADGDVPAARELQKALNPLALAVTSRFGVPGLKAALACLGVPVGGARSPLLPVTDAEYASIERLVEDARPHVLEV